MDYLTEEEEWLVHYWARRAHRSHCNAGRWRPNQEALDAQVEALAEELCESEEAQE